MKKLIYKIVLLGLLVFPLMALGAPATLYEYYDGNLPSISERQDVAIQAGISGYRGSYDQNVALLGYLVNLGRLGANIPVSSGTFYLAQPLSSSATTIYFTSVNDLRGNTVEAANLPTKVYFTLEPNNSDNTEIVMCPSSGYASSTKSFSSCSRGLAFQGSSEAEVTANKKSHPSGAKVVMSNVGQFYNNFVDIDSNQTIDGIKTFADFPVTPSSAPTSSYQVANKKYVDDTAIAGGVIGTESVPGIWEGATQAETAAGTATSTYSGNDYNLVLQSKYAKSTSSATTTIPVTDTDGKLDQGFIDLTESFTFSGGLTSSATTTLGYATVPTSTPTAAGQIVGLDASSKLPAVDGSQLTGVGQLAVFNLGIVSDASVSTTTVTKTLSQDVGIVPKYFEADIVVAKVVGETFNYDGNASIEYTSVHAYGIIGGNIVFYGYKDNNTRNPQKYAYLTPQGLRGQSDVSTSYTVYDFSYGSGTTSSPGIYTNNASDRLALSSISLTGTTISFNFTWTKNSNNNGLRYGVQNLIVSN